MDENGNMINTAHYYPGGSIFGESNVSWHNSNLFQGGRLERIYSHLFYDLQNRHYDPILIRFNSIDELCEKTFGVSPYIYGLGNPTLYCDPTGLTPIYSLDGDFLGTDDMGLNGLPYVMDPANFVQGMSHFDAGNYAVMTGISDDAWKKILDHYANLKYRPDYDGYVTIIEGIQWAMTHPYALKNPTPDNTLYIDTSKMDFGALSVDDFDEIGVSTPQNLFDWSNVRISITNSNVRATVYALGRVNMILHNRKYGTISIVNNNATDYDWNTGGGSTRDIAIRINNSIFFLDPSKHGFKTYYYGFGTIRQ